MTRLWKVMETLIEYYGFDRESCDSSFVDNCKDTYVYDDGFNKVVFEIYYNGKDATVDDMWCTVYEGDNYDEVFEQSLYYYDCVHLSDFIDQLWKDFRIE